MTAAQRKVVPTDTDMLHGPGHQRWLHCDRCLGYRTRHLPEAGGLRCEGCHTLKGADGKPVAHPEECQCNRCLRPQFHGAGDQLQEDV